MFAIKNEQSSNIEAEKGRLIKGSYLCSNAHGNDPPGEEFMMPRKTEGP